MVTPKARINHQIKVPEVRVIDDNGKMLGILKLHEALRIAEERQLDLVEISPQADPPLAKILDYGKYRYQQEKIAQEARKKTKKITVKGIRLSVRIGQHDLQFKAKQASEFLAEGNKIKLEVVMRGREQAHANLAFDLIKKFQSLITVPVMLESGPSRMGNTVSIIIAPSK